MLIAGAMQWLLHDDAQTLSSLSYTFFTVSALFSVLVAFAVFAPAVGFWLVVLVDDFVGLDRYPEPSWFVRDLVERVSGVSPIVAWLVAFLCLASGFALAEQIFVWQSRRDEQRGVTFHWWGVRYRNRATRS